jgi:hypothetical protein
LLFAAKRRIKATALFPLSAPFTEAAGVIGGKVSPLHAPESNALPEADILSPAPEHESFPQKTMELIKQGLTAFLPHKRMMISAISY